jgi:adenylate cyclase
MDDHPEELDIEELTSLGLYDPAGPDAADRLELLRYVWALGATTDQIAASRSLGDLALDLNLRSGPWLPLTEVVSASGLEWDDAERLLTALGFPARPDDLVTAEEAAAIQLLGAASTRLLGLEATVQVARVAGTAIARVAESLVGVFRLRFELPRLQGGSAYSDVVKEYSTVTEEVLPGFIQTLDVLLRRQLVAVADRVWSTDAEHTAVTLARTIGFADLVGYTAVSATMSVGELAAVLAEFDERVTNVVYRGNGQLVKTLGDEAMFVTEAAGDACRIALRLVDEFASGPLPPVRVGLAAGRVLSAFGDVYGPDVNLASRLVGAADPSTVVVSESVAAESADDFRFAALDPLTLKGFVDPITAFRLQEPRPLSRSSEEGRNSAS